MLAARWFVGFLASCFFEAVVLVHSANPVGLSNIKAPLPKAINAPRLWEYVDEVITKLNL